MCKNSLFWRMAIIGISSIIGQVLHAQEASTTLNNYGSQNAPNLRLESVNVHVTFIRYNSGYAETVNSVSFQHSDYSNFNILSMNFLDASDNNLVARLILTPDESSSVSRIKGKSFQLLDFIGNQLEVDQSKQFCISDKNTYLELNADEGKKLLAQSKSNGRKLVECLVAKIPLARLNKAQLGKGLVLQISYRSKVGLRTFRHEFREPGLITRKVLAKGDLNDDGEINLLDLDLALRFRSMNLNADENARQDEIRYSLDIDGDNKVNSRDITLLLRMLPE